MAANFIKCEPDDPHRCQGTIPNIGQCTYLAEPGIEYCPLHMKKSRFVNREKQDYNYQLTKYRARVIEFAENPKVKNLREEIGVLRLVLEATVNRCQNDNDLLIYSGKISDMVTRIEKVVVACNTIETKTGQLLDRSAIINMIDGILQILTMHITDSDILEAIGSSITTLLGEKYTAEM